MSTTTTYTHRTYLQARGSMISTSTTSCLRCGNLSTFLDNVAVPASNEPLQFLYPSFAKGILLGCQASESRARFSSTRRSKLRGNHKKFQQPYTSVNAKSRRWLTQGSHLATNGNVGDVEVSPRAETSYPELYRDADLDRFDDGGRRTDRLRTRANEHETGPRIEPEVDKILNHRSSNEPMFDEGTINGNVEYGHMENEVFNAGEYALTTPMMQSEVPPPDDRKLLTLMRKRDMALAAMTAYANTPGESKKLRYRQFIALKPKNKHKRRPHWTELMARLERMHHETIVEPIKGTRKEILLREETVAFFSGTTRSMENIWYVRIRNGCKVHVLDSIESEGIYRKVVLTGTKRVIELVEKQLQQFDEQIRQSDVPPVVPSMLALRQQGLTPPLVRRWWFSPSDHDNRMIVSKPVSGTVVTSVRAFNSLVEQWVYYEPPVKGRWHTSLVKDELVALFTRPENKLYFSSNALHLALNFLTEHEFLNSVRKVFYHAKTVATANTFNVFLQASAKRQDPWFYRYVLTEMEKSGVQPNGHTWMTLLKSLVSPGPRKELMKRMKEFGLLEDTRVLHDMIEHDISSLVSDSLEEGNDIQTFLESLERDYGSDIITTNLLNQILNAVYLRRDLKLTADILKSFERFGIAPNARTFTAALSIFFRIGPAVGIMTPYLREHEYLLHHRHYDMLFLDAIASNAINACRVIWRYASMRGETSSTMRYIVLSSLLGKRSARHVTNPEHINHHIGSLVIGLNYPQTQPTTRAASLVPPQFQTNPLIYLLHNRDNMPASEKINLVKALMEDDVEGGPQHIPLEPFTVMLDAAVRLDSSPEYSWDRPEGGGHPGMKKLPTIEILKRIIDVPIE
ncbi:conserved hypothetical protein [Talaromyces stipitatus ATCC 10500]|uniref:Pentatricopeptide repeat protein n=1 Tax=Talaromyces stipitatus (strain ATCC 10500 / CBS 375.48 / QM 6759 / NRRL 1006) TaxID=441959 RepID=B8LUP1_TALSN|nr:uncharacterized protein TSTA_072880 [Talaromyces stipitatus ATCC 10500]EED23898.1 conserved hypothetical protein [Talaromyces stipitatus ATCC 10500]